MTESFVNGHLHLDKVDTLAMAGEDVRAAYNGSGMGRRDDGHRAGS